MPGKPSPQWKVDDRRRVAVGLDSGERVDLVGLADDASSARLVAMPLSEVSKNSSKVSTLGVAANELLQRRGQAGDADLGELDLLLERQLGRVVLDRDLLLALDQRATR